VALLSLGLSACQDVEVRPFPPGQGQDPNADAARYPAGPYSVTLGGVIPNFKLQGYPDPTVDRTTLQPMQLADFYNPTGDEAYPPASIYGEGPKPKALWLNVSAIWCGPCQYESAEVLPVEHAKYAPLGAELLLYLADTAVVGDPAQGTHLTLWTEKYGTAWPAVVDPSYKLASSFQGATYPINIVIDTRTMVIETTLNGIPQPGSQFYSTLEAVLEQ
jgi:hypothetical protein